MTIQNSVGCQNTLKNDSEINMVGKYNQVFNNLVGMN